MAFITFTYSKLWNRLWRGRECHGSFPSSLHTERLNPVICLQLHFIFVIPERHTSWSLFQAYILVLSPLKLDSFHC